MIVTVGATKGGVGKTTIALNIAIARAMTGRRVWLIDGDRQATAQTAIGLRAEAQRVPMVAVSQFSDGRILRAQVIHQQATFDDIVIDVGGRDSMALRAALLQTDTLVLPFLPRSFDVWALDDMAQLLSEARQLRDGLRVVAVLNQADPAGSDNGDALSVASDLGDIEVAKFWLGRRKAYANAAGAGLSVLENVPIDIKARREVEQLLAMVFIANRDESTIEVA